MKKIFITIFTIILIAIYGATISYAKYSKNISATIFKISQIDLKFLDNTSPAVIYGQITTEAPTHEYDIKLYTSYNSEAPEENLIEVSSIEKNSSTRRIYNLFLRFNKFYFM